MPESLGNRLRAYANKDGRGYPDWAMRYMPVVRKLRERGLADATVVEIGANTNGFARFAHVRTIVTDIAPAHLREARESQDVLAVAADIAALPFRPGAVDVCVCMDTFEHVPEEARPTAVKEIAALLKQHGTAAIGFPSGAEAEAAEEKIRGYYNALTGERIKWLAEHKSAGLPEAAAIVRLFREAAGPGRKVEARKNTPLLLWVWMWKIMMCGWPGRGNAVFQAALRLFTPLLTRLHFGRCYRTMIWLEPEE